MRRLAYSLLPVLLLATTGYQRATDDLDQFIMSQLQRRGVAGLSIAIIEGGRVVDARAYGVTDAGAARVDTTTQFLAGSISKAVAATAALRLVEMKKLDLDSDVNSTLRSWKLPSSPFTTSKVVTLRELLSHTAGLTVHGFEGYAPSDPVPTLAQVLDGAPPANSAPIRNDTFPGARWNYSGGGYTIMQQMIIDVTGEHFPAFMRKNVLAPIGMSRSSYEQPVSVPVSVKRASGHYQDGSTVVGRWHLYPEMAAAGLWTTPSDLARFAIEVQRAYAGQSAKVISPAMTRQMLTVERDGDGLGVFLSDTGRALRFGHGGRDEGFDADLTATASTGQGVVIMINANDNSSMVARIRNFVAAKYHWPNTSSFAAPKSFAMSAARVADVAGRYERSNNNTIAFVNRGTQLFTLAGGHPDEEFVFTDADHIESVERSLRYAIVRDAGGGVAGFTVTAGAVPTPIPRIGPLFAAIKPQPSDASADARVESTLRILANGKAGAATAPGTTPGFQHDFSEFDWPAPKGLKSIQFLGARNVTGGTIERHGAAVSKVAYYRMMTAKTSVLLLVYLTADGLITDFDDVDA